MPFTLFLLRLFLFLFPLVWKENDIYELSAQGTANLSNHRAVYSSSSSSSSKWHCVELRRFDHGLARSLECPRVVRACVHGQIECCRCQATWRSVRLVFHDLPALPPTYLSVDVCLSVCLSVSTSLKSICLMFAAFNCSIGNRLPPLPTRELCNIPFRTWFALAMQIPRWDKV